MAVDKDGMKRRNIEIGQILHTARAMRSASISECAARIGTSRQRYADVEKGESYITVVELEELMEYLRIPREVVWPGGSAGGERRKIVRVPVVLDPDENTHLIIELSTGE